MEQILFSLGSLDITTHHIVGISLVVLFGLSINNLINRYLIKNWLKREEVVDEKRRAFHRMIGILIWLICAFLIMAFIGIDQVITTTSAGFDFKISHFIQGLVIIQLARVVDWAISNLFINRYYSKRDEQPNYTHDFNEKKENSVNKVVQYIVYVLAIIFLLGVFNIDFTLFERNFNNEIVRFRISGIFFAILTLLIAQLVIWVVTQLILYGVYRTRKIDIGAQYAINQLVRYIVYVFAFVIVLDNIGLNITILLGGAAALLVGVGLGLQQTFNDFISGLVLLFERTVAVGDVLDVDGTKGTVKKIGLRASTIETRGNVTVLLPNSKLVNEKVTNWSHFDDKVRFEVSIGVAYGTDVDLVKDILLDIAKKNPYIINYPSPFVRLNEFADSAVNFTLYFFSRNFIVIEDIKSDIRFEIARNFKEKGVTIPFPQMDVYIQKP